MKRIFKTGLILISCLLPIAFQAKTVEVKKAGQLTELLTDDEKKNIEELTIVGKLNSSDIILLRKMAGAKDKNDSNPWTGNLKKLDLQKAKFVDDDTPYHSYQAAKNYKIVKDIRYNVTSVNTRTGESTVRSREDYMSDLQEYQNSSSQRMLESGNVGRRTNSIEQLEEGRHVYVLNDITEKEWMTIKRKGWNKHTDHFESKEDTVYYVNWHTAKNWISGYLFYNCKNLESVILNKDIEYISINAFAGCSALREIVIPKKVQKINSSAFKRNQSLQRVVISKDTECKQLKMKDSAIIKRLFKEASEKIEIIRD